MSKWSDYAITAVRYDTGRNHITHLWVRQVHETSLSGGAEWTRSQVVASLEAGHSFVTAVQKGDLWYRGAEVHVIQVGLVKYLRTDGNQLAQDNLGSLPEIVARSAGLRPW